MGSKIVKGLRVENLLIKASHKKLGICSLCRVFFTTMFEVKTGMWANERRPNFRFRQKRITHVNRNHEIMKFSFHFKTNMQALKSVKLFTNANIVFDCNFKICFWQEFREMKRNYMLLFLEFFSWINLQQRQNVKSVHLIHFLPYETFSRFDFT